MSRSIERQDIRIEQDCDHTSVNYNLLIPTQRNSLREYFCIFMTLPGVSLHSALFQAGNSETSVSTWKSIREISQADPWAEDVEKQLSEITHAFCSDNKDLWTCWNRDRKQVAEGEMLYTVTHAFDCESTYREFCFILSTPPAFSLSDFWASAVHS